MLFNSIEFLVFFISVFTFYWIVSKYLTIQNLLLLISSYIFYAWWDWRFLSLIIFSSFLDYWVGLKVAGTAKPQIKYRWLIVSLVSNLGLLGVFKYYNFFTSSFQQACRSIGWQIDDFTLEILLPVGISFYTFQTLSYTIDIYRGNIEPTKSILSFFTYVAFFPQLVAGPIERASNLIPQISVQRTFSLEDFKAGIFQIGVGLFRKIVVADTLAQYVDLIFAKPDIYNSTTLVLALIFYAIQIYCDFAGYSDIAIGTAKLLGFKFLQNFNIPYFARSLTDFWRRWHKSLSFWLRDYLYISLGGNRKGINLTYRNLMITMLLGGLWHGSSWNFVIWGGIHGTILFLEKYIGDKGFSLSRWTVLGNFSTLVVVLFAWIFFRTPDLETAWSAINSIVNLDLGRPFVGDNRLMANSFFVLTTTLVFDFYLFKSKLTLESIGEVIESKWLLASLIFITMLLTLFHSNSTNFIYFQF